MSFHARRILSWLSRGRTFAQAGVFAGDHETFPTHVSLKGRRNLRKKKWRQSTGEKVATGKVSLRAAREKYAGVSPRTEEKKKLGELRGRKLWK